MSHVVEPRDLAARLDEYGHVPYLVYPGRSGAARINHVVVERVEQNDDRTFVVCRGHGRGVPERVDAGVAMSLLWPAPSAGTYSLIADGQPAIVDDELVLEISGAVLHRPAPVDGPTTC